MQVVKTIHKQQLISILCMAVLVLVAFGILCYLDSDTRQFSDLFKEEDIVGLTVYFVPTMIVCFLFYQRFRNTSSNAASAAKAVLLSIPLCFTLIIVILVTLKRITVL